MDQTSMKSAKVVLEGEQECPIIYANFASTIATPMDIQIVFAMIGNPADSIKGEISARAAIRVVMAPEHAALLARVMLGHVGQYINQHGPLRGAAGKMVEELANAAKELASRTNQPESE